MSSAPHALSAHPSAWAVEPSTGVRTEDPTYKASFCHHCGQPLRGWQEPYHLNDDHSDERPDNVVASCPLCHLQQHLNRPTIDAEAILIWMPEVTQRAVVGLARAAHVALWRSQITPYVTTLPTRPLSESAKAAFATLRTLQSRSSLVEQLLGTSSPKVLGAALMSLPAEVYDDRVNRLGGLRLLPRGRIYDGSDDIYGRILASWSTPITT